MPARPGALHRRSRPPTIRAERPTSLLHTPITLRDVEFRTHLDLADVPVLLGRGRAHRLASRPPPRTATGGGGAASPRGQRSSRRRAASARTTRASGRMTGGGVPPHHRVGEPAPAGHPDAHAGRKASVDAPWRGSGASRRARVAPHQVDAPCPSTTAGSAGELTAGEIGQREVVAAEDGGRLPAAQITPRSPTSSTPSSRCRESARRLRRRLDRAPDSRSSRRGARGVAAELR